ncbi:MAG: hypothetical protein JWO80_1021 [Bryobacterales bacterium]|nr:hypothetical protein [Bryobacterales bacterium]
MAREDNQEIEERIVPVSGLVPMLAVLDVERSVAFYKLLGFAVGNRLPRDGPMHWAWLYAPNVPDYLDATNLVALREELVRAETEASGCRK